MLLCCSISLEHNKATTARHSMQAWLGKAAPWKSEFLLGKSLRPWWGSSCMCAGAWRQTGM